MARIGRLTVLAAVVAGLSTGCSTMSNTTKGAGIGTAIGAGTGTLIGAATGNPKTGAVVGGLIGGGVGAGVGNDMDREDREKSEIRQTEATIAAAEAQAATRRLGMTEVVQMVQSGQSEDVIINQINITGSTFQLSTADLAYLKQTCNVPDRVIIAMQNARPRPQQVVVQPRPRTVVVRDPYYDPYYYPPPPVVFVRPPPPVGFGFTYVGGGRRW